MAANSWLSLSSCNGGRSIAAIVGACLARPGIIILELSFFSVMFFGGNKPPFNEESSTFSVGKVQVLLLLQTFCP
jgi:hypothetical protein